MAAEFGNTRSSCAAVRSNVPAIAALSTARVSSVGLRSRPSKSAFAASPGQSAITVRLRQARTEHEPRARRAVIGAARAVGPRRAAELGHDDDGGVLPRGAHVGAERDESFRELSEQTIERAAGHPLVRVRVPAAELHRRDVRALLLSKDPARPPA